MKPIKILKLVVPENHIQIQMTLKEFKKFVEKLNLAPIFQCGDHLATIMPDGIVFFGIPKNEKENQATT